MPYNIKCIIHIFIYLYSTIKCLTIVICLMYQCVYTLHYHYLIMHMAVRYICAQLLTMSTIAVCNISESINVRTYSQCPQPTYLTTTRATRMFREKLISKIIIDHQLFY